mmetsp:Transcript_124479/g.265334  ORF Transcript_124479/g.265334 Transcript_124479/m.265334 type:complete len:81 (-) Transcript_124479:537-779(-)
MSGRHIAMYAAAVPNCHIASADMQDPCSRASSLRAEDRIGAREKKEVIFALQGPPLEELAVALVRIGDNREASGAFVVVI